jgi:hypothetical protein
MMHVLQSEFYGDNTRWFMARVIDATPPYGLEGRVKIRIIGVHSDNVLDIPQNDLPWAQVVLPGSTFGSSGFGNVPQILPGALVFGIFLDGKQSQLPIVLGSLPKIEYPTSVQADSRDDIATNPFAYDYRQSNYEGVDPGTQNVDISNADQRKSVAVRFFIDNGYTLEQTCGIVGTLFAMTEIDPLYSDSGFIGIAGWPTSSNRYIRLNRFAASFKPAKTAESFDLQLIFVLNELRTTRTLANGKLFYADKVKGNSGTTSKFYDYFLDHPSKFIVSKEECVTVAESLLNAAMTGSFEP